MGIRNSLIMTFHILTIFSGILSSYINESLFKRSQKNGLVKFNFINIRDFATDKHRKVDDSPYGGGPGMVMKVEPIYKAIQALNSKFQIPNSKQTNKKSKSKMRIILFSTRGKKFDSKVAKRLSKYDHLILICGRYEGIDERVAKHIADEEISVGDYVLSGGELPAMILAEAVSRYIPGFLGKYESLEDIKGSYPVYTRPEVFVAKKKKLRVPEELLSGSHKKIEEWRNQHS